MFNWFKKAYHNYKDYVRVDMAMYGLLILMIIIYIIYSALS
jgi:hypothetical protein